MAKAATRAEMHGMRCVRTEDIEEAVERRNLHAGSLPAEASLAFVAGLRVELVPFRLCLPSDKATRRHLDRSLHRSANCPNMLDRH